MRKVNNYVVKQQPSNTSGIQGKPPTPVQLAEVRSRALARLEELGPGAVLGEDIERLRNSDEYVRR